jgi:hypothetical protein
MLPQVWQDAQDNIVIQFIYAGPGARSDQPILTYPKAREHGIKRGV